MQKLIDVQTVEGQKTRSQSVTSALRELIVQGALKPQAHVQEVVVGEMLGVSRTPVRSALAALASEGLLEYFPNRGYFVRAFDVEELLETYEVRANLEGLAARRAAQNLSSQEDAAQLLALADAGDAIIGKGSFLEEDVLPYQKINMEFHEAIVRISGNRKLDKVIEQTLNIPLLTSRVIFWKDFEVIKRSNDDHRRLVQAIVARDGLRAESLMREHVYYRGLVLRDLLKEQAPGALLAA